MGRTWIRVERGMLTDVKLLGRPGWYVLLWLVLLCQADDGVLQGVTGDDLLTLLRMDTIAPGDVEQALAYFEKRGMIRRGAREGDAEPTIVVNNYFRYQPKDVTGAERQARFKERHGTAGNGTVTAGNIQTDIQTDKQEEALSPNGGPAGRVFAFWQKHLGKAKAVFDPKRRRAVELRLKEGFTEEDLCKAIRGCKSDPFSQGDNDRRMKYDDLLLICRDAAHVEKFMALEDGPLVRARGPSLTTGEAGMRKAARDVVSTREMLDRKLTVPATTPEQRAETLRKINEMKGKL